MHCDGKWLDHCSVYEINIIRNPVENVLGDDDELRERPIASIFSAGDPQDPTIVAQVDLASSAMPA
jgi:hypothetical protein